MLAVFFKVKIIFLLALRKSLAFGFIMNSFRILSRTYLIENRYFCVDVLQWM